MSLIENVYVRCPILDREYLFDPRDFIVGRIVSVDEYAEQLTVHFFDPFGYRQYYESIPEEHPYAVSMVERCELLRGTKIRIGKENGVIICRENKENDMWYYYVQLDSSKEVILCSEAEIEAPFSEGKISPHVQLSKYEFQNPTWYIGRSVVNKFCKILDNAMFGFKELAGCKIYLMPHQLNAIMRCYQENRCRYMLADEVGMGKTIEASAILKLYLQKNSRKKVLIIVPESLKEQWRVELFLKFDISIGVDSNGNCINLLSFLEFENNNHERSLDFVIIDEAHRLLNKDNYYEYYNLSRNSENLLLLSATPLQRRSRDYLNLLKLLDPGKYEDFSDEEFEKLVSLQSKIITRIMGVIDDVDDLQDEIKDSDEDDVKTNSRCLDLFNDIIDGLEITSSLIQDEAFDQLVADISSEDEELGIGKMLVAISYVCDNYQIERNIIRNRRNMLYKEEYSTHTRPIRKLSKVIKYQCSASEYSVYEFLLERMESEGKLDSEILTTVYKPLMNAYFSSATAFNQELQKSHMKKNRDLVEIVEKWMAEERYNVDNIKELLNNPEDTESRLLAIVDYLDQELYEKKIVLFTSFSETFELYQKVLRQVYNENDLAFFSKNMTSDDRELNIYRFQNEKGCHILLCDKTGGEGRNFQIADYLVHLDLPWDANEIEQRIGRLDRLERDPARPIVNSVVVVSEESLEEQLFDFWNRGLNVFEESLSGLEIVLEEINNHMFSAMSKNIRYGLFNEVPQIIEMTTQLKKEIKREQRFDTIGYLYKPMNRQIGRLLRYYSANENALFSQTMLNWASLAGFKANGKGDVITFRASEFQLNSAKNTLLIPPNWTAYLQSKQMEFATRISELYSKYKAKGLSDGKEIKGTFNRKVAIDNDYLHFFAPGDAIFDCIVENAIRSTKGQATAFAMRADIDWEGFVYAFSVTPNERLLLSKGISPSEIAYFRNYLTANVAIVPIGLEKYQETSREQVILEYEKLIKKGYKYIHSTVDHLGKRGRSGGGFLHISHQYHISNMEWFKNRFPSDLWKSYVDGSYDIARKTALKELAHKSHLSDAKEEIQRLIAAKVASDAFFGRHSKNAESLKKKYDIIYESLKKPVVTLESACFIWMVK